MGRMEDGKMKTVAETWLVLTLAIGTAMMASGVEWVDEPLRWNTKGEPAAVVNGPGETVDGGESVASVPEAECIEKEAAEEQPATPEPKKVPPKNRCGRKAGKRPGKS